MCVWVLNHFSCVRLFATLWTVACQAPLSRFSRQEYWNGLPWLPPGDLPNPGIEPRSRTLQADSLPSEPQGKPKNTGVGSPLLLQWIFLTQELNQGLLHYRRILYQLSYQRCPAKPWGAASKPQAREVKAVYLSTHLLTIHPTIHTLNQPTTHPPI